MTPGEIDPERPRPARNSGVFATALHSGCAATSKTNGAIRARHFGESPLVEDNSAKSPPYTTIDLQIGYRPSDRWLVALDIFNLFDKKWNDIEYYYVSRLANEASPQPDYVVHPGVPLTVRLSFRYQLGRH